MLTILPALDAAFEAREPLRDIAQPPLYGTQASIQAGNLAPEEPADREHGESVDQHFHSSKRKRRQPVLTTPFGGIALWAQAQKYNWQPRPATAHRGRP